MQACSKFDQMKAKQLLEQRRFQSSTGFIPKSLYVRMICKSAMLLSFLSSKFGQFWFSSRCIFFTESKGMTGKEWNGTKTKFSSLFALPCYFMERSHRFQLFHCRRKSLFAFALPCFSSIHVSRLLRKSKGMKMKPIVPCFQSLINSQVKSIYTFVMMMTGQV